MWIVWLGQTLAESGSAAISNIGLSIASGRYITFIDSNDTIDNNYLESQIEFIKDNGPLITVGYRKERDRIITTFIPRDEITFQRL